MALKARKRPTWRKHRQRSGLPTPPGCKFMTVAQRRASGRSTLAKARDGAVDSAKAAARKVAEVAGKARRKVSEAVSG